MAPIVTDLRISQDLVISKREQKVFCLRYTRETMNPKNYWAYCLISFLLTACVTVSSGGASTDSPILFVTSTLPPTKPGVVLPTEIPPTLTETPIR